MYVCASEGENSFIAEAGRERERERESACVIFARKASRRLATYLSSPRLLFRWDTYCEHEPSV